MATIIVMPKLVFNMEQGKVMEWHKQVGDSVKAGEPFYSVETNKSTAEELVPCDGVVRALLIPVGESVNIDVPIAIIGDESEDVSALITQCTEQIKAQVAIAPSTAPKPAASFASGSNGETSFDVAVLGGGPGGYVAAIKAAQMGKKTCLIEKENLGGVCLNQGCIPTKTLLQSVEMLKEVRESARYGVMGVDIGGASLDMVKVQERKSEVVSTLVQGVAGLLGGNGVTVFQGNGRIDDANTIIVDGKSITAGHIIMATGSKSKRLPIPTSPKAKLLTSTEALDLTELPVSIAIVGGGVIGIEFAYFFASLGVEVTVVEFLGTILPMVDEEISRMVKKSLEKLGAQIYTSARVSEITEEAVVFVKDEETHTVPCNQVLMAVGRTPNIAGLDNQKLGITLNRGAILTDQTMRTTAPNIYAIGDVNGKAMLAHVASMEGVVAVENICGHKTVMEYDKIPSCIYIQPEIACVGLTEAQAKEKYGDVKVGKFPMQASGKALVAGNSQGIVKIILEPVHHKIVGAHLYCIHATDMIAEIVVAMQGDMAADDLLSVIHPHPTVSEAVHEALHAAVDRAIHSL